MSQPVELNVGGKSYRVVASEDEATLRRLAAAVDERLHALVGPSRTVPAQALVLVALALAHELEQERALRCRHQQRSRTALSRVLGRIDAALASTAPAPPPATGTTP
jgi:cell division protein ZapA